METQLPHLPTLKLLINDTGKIKGLLKNRSSLCLKEGEWIQSHLTKNDQFILNECLKTLKETGEPVQADLRWLLNGTYECLNCVIITIADNQFELYGYESQERLEQLCLLQTERDLYKNIIKGTPLTELLAMMAVQIENQFADSYCTILLYDPQKQQFMLGASPAFSFVYRKALGELSCYNLDHLKEILNKNKPQLINHLPNIIKGEDYVHLLEALHINQLRVVPIVTNEKGMLGAALIFHKKMYDRVEVENQLLSRLIKMTAIVLDRYYYHQSLQQPLFQDVLTGLPNRSYILSKIEERIYKAEKRKETFALLYIDCDRFKMLNDSLGHSEGDYILKKMGQKITSLLKEHDKLGRIASDKFVLLLNDTHTKVDVETVIKEIQNAFKEPWMIKKQSIYLSVSIGVVEYPLNGNTAESLLRRAEIALSHGKKEGINQVRYYHNEDALLVPHHLTLENDLHFALNRNELIIYYQPQVNIEKGIVEGAEALIRWRHPKLGLLTPNEFVPILEETGMIVEVGKWILRTVCFQQVEWVRLGLRPLSVSVNISPQQFKSRDLVHSVKAALSLSGMDPCYLKLEITENMLIENPVDTLQILNQLNEIGVGVSIDDFGTGYSSLSYIKKFPVETIKIDRAFVREIDQDLQDQAIVKAIIEMGNSLNVALIAEGTESDRQIIYLKRAGCNIIQGYYFSKPISAAQFQNQILLWERLAEKLRVSC